MTQPPDLITAATAVTRLWGLVLFTAGTDAARQKRADVRQEAVRNLSEALAKVREGQG